jgi:hypothetical protein
MYPIFHFNKNNLLGKRLLLSLTTSTIYELGGAGLNLSVSILLFNLYLRYFSLIIPAEIPAVNQDKSCSDTVILRSSGDNFVSNLHEKSGYLSEQSVTAP